MAGYSAAGSSTDAPVAQPMAAHRAIDHEGEAAREVERACQEPVPRLEDDGEAPIAAALAVVDAVLQRGGVVRAAVAAGRARRGRRVAGRRGQRGGQRGQEVGVLPAQHAPACRARQSARRRRGEREREQEQELLRRAAELRHRAHRLTAAWELGTASVPADHQTAGRGAPAPH
jgi:hypothetical protein